jgi:protein TonB
MIVLSLLLSNQSAQASLEKRAVGATQRTLASDLDTELPKLPFVDWFEKVIGPGTGVIWQLSECGEQGEASLNATSDMRACVEANTILHDGRRVIVMISVGTFKKGMIGAPAFNLGVIEKKGELYPFRRLGDLQRLLSAPGSVPNRPAVKLPDANMPEVKPVANNAHVAVAPAWGGEEFGRFITVEEAPPPAPPPRVEPATLTATPIAEKRPGSEDSGQTVSSGEVKLEGAISFGDVIKRVPARYPARARKMNASGPVNVRITISETGRVIDAKAISGHPLLREAAEEAARQWVFKPAMLNDAPVKTETTLVFLFKVPQ